MNTEVNRPPTDKNNAQRQIGSEGRAAGTPSRLASNQILDPAVSDCHTLPMRDSESVRLDIWLDVACIFKSRSQAQAACKMGRVEVNGDSGKPHRAVRPGDTIRISLSGGRKRTIEVVELENTNVPKARARELYIDHTPPPTAEEIELRRMQRLSMPPRRSRGMGAPKKQERRRLRRLKEGEES